MANVTVRYWAAAKDAASTGEEKVNANTLADAIGVIRGSRVGDTRFVNVLKRSRERHRFLRGMVSWAGFNQTGVEYDRDERHAGVTKYPVSKMLKFAIDGITSFSDVPLKFASWLGFSASTVAFIYALVVIGVVAVGLAERGLGDAGRRRRGGATGDEPSQHE